MKNLYQNLKRTLWTGAAIGTALMSACTPEKPAMHKVEFEPEIESAPYKALVVERNQDPYASTFIRLMPDYDGLNQGKPVIFVNADADERIRDIQNDEYDSIELEKVTRDSTGNLSSEYCGWTPERELASDVVGCTESELEEAVDLLNEAVQNLKEKEPTIWWNNTTGDYEDLVSIPVSCILNNQSLRDVSVNMGYGTLDRNLSNWPPYTLTVEDKPVTFYVRVPESSVSGTVGEDFLKWPFIDWEDQRAVEEGMKATEECTPDYIDDVIAGLRVISE